MKELGHTERAERDECDANSCPNVSLASLGVLRPVVESFHEAARGRIVAVYVFGSQATGRSKVSSDLDIAVLLSEPSSDSFPFLELKAALESVLGRDIDLVILNHASEILKHHVRRDGRLVYESSSVLRKSWEMKGRKTYEDFLHLHSIYRKALYRKYGVNLG